MSESTALERLYAEELPTGTFGGARTSKPAADTKARHTTAPTAHLRELADAIGAPHHTPIPAARRTPTQEPAA